MEGGGLLFLSLCKRVTVSHQLCGDSTHHLEIRTAAVQYLRDNPGQFIESILNRSWVEYLSNMSIQGTWANHSIIQAVADSLNLTLFRRGFLMVFWDGQGGGADSAPTS